LSSSDTARDARPTLSALGWMAELTSDLDPELTPGRIVRVDRGRAMVATDSGTLGAAVAIDEPVVTGDWVGLSLEPRPEVSALVPRRTVITRYDTSFEMPQPLAANMDVILILHGLDLRPKHRRMERALVMAWDSGARPVVVLSKADVAAGGPDGTDAAVTEGEMREIAVGADVVAVSAVTGRGMDRLRGLLHPGETILVFGESGVGKSTLINALAGEDLRDTGPTRVADRRGRHTTTSRELVPLASGLVLLDTPGVRTLGLWDATDGLEAAFADVEAAAARCRFRDCRHDGEPGCSVRRAIELGDLHPDRVASFRKLGAEMARLERRRKAVEGRIARRARPRSKRRSDWRREWE
jgi:ribosome biogenesis GTPase